MSDTPLPAEEGGRDINKLRDAIWNGIYACEAGGRRADAAREKGRIALDGLLRIARSASVVSSEEGGRAGPWQDCGVTACRPNARCMRRDDCCTRVSVVGDASEGEADAEDEARTAELMALYGCSREELEAIRRLEWVCGDGQGENDMAMAIVWGALTEARASLRSTRAALEEARAFVKRAADGDFDSADDIEAAGETALAKLNAMTGGQANA